MKIRFLDPDKSFDFETPPARLFDDLIQDLELKTLFLAMAQEDPLILEVSQKVLLAGSTNLRVTAWRQAIVNDCLKNSSLVRQIYALAVNAINQERQNYLSLFIKHPSFVISRSSEVLQMFFQVLRSFRQIAETEAQQFRSEGFHDFFAMLRNELTDDYLAELKSILDELKFGRGIRLSAQLGKGNKGERYILCKDFDQSQSWLQRLKSSLFGRTMAYTFTIADRDDNAAKAVSDLYDHGINQTANVLAQSTDHILAFFVALRKELSFFLGVVNLKEKLEARQVAWCFPELVAGASIHRRFENLVNVTLALQSQSVVIGHDVDANLKDFILVTGANQGGKTTFLRSLGLAQIMAQAGIFVTASKSSLSLVDGVFTHFRRGEDTKMRSGKFDEELARMNALVPFLRANSLILLNESFAATNEREGSEISRQIVSALIERQIQVIFVSHQYEFARIFFELGGANHLFLQAQPSAPQKNQFHLTQGIPQPSANGVDLYREIFEK